MELVGLPGESHRGSVGRQQGVGLDFHPVQRHHTHRPGARPAAQPQPLGEQRGQFPLVAPAEAGNGHGIRLLAAGDHPEGHALAAQPLELPAPPFADAVGVPRSVTMMEGASLSPSQPWARYHSQKAAGPLTPPHRSGTRPDRSRATSREGSVGADTVGHGSPGGRCLVNAKWK